MKTNNKSKDPMLPPSKWDDRFKAVISQSTLGFSEVTAATRIKEDLHRLEWQPLDTPGLFFGDIVAVTKRGEELVIKEVVRRSPLDCKVVSGLSNTKEGRAFFQAISTLGRISPYADGEFTIYATEENMPKIEKLLSDANIRITDFWWNNTEILKSAHEKVADLQHRTARWEN